MPRNKNAQTVTEYLALVTMLGLALALGWDFISGGFQGGVKNLTQSVDIATRDVIRQGDPPPQLPYCNCDDDLNNWNCGEEPTTPILPTIDCNERQRYKRKLCTGTLCTQAQIEWCEWDPTCCIWLGPDPSGGVDHCWDDYCPQPTSGTQGWGNGRFLRQCGNNPVFHECQGDTVCRFQCGWNTITSSQVGPNPPSGSAACPGDDTQVPNNAIPWTMVTNGLLSNCSNPQSAIWCERYCPVGTGWNQQTQSCDPVVCGDGIIHPTLEYCDPGGSNTNPLPETQFGFGGSGPRLQKQACLDNCQTLGYRYYMRHRNHNATLSNPTWHPGNAGSYYVSHSGSQDHIYVTCTNDKVVRLHESSPIERIWGPPNDPCMAENCCMMYCENNQAVLNACNSAWGQCGYNNSAQGSPTCRIRSNCGFGSANHATYGFVCEDPTPLNCWGISYHRLWENGPREPVCSGAVNYAGMNLPASYQAFEYCEGDCGPNDNRVKLCCRDNSTPNINGQCYAIPQELGPWNSCASGFNMWFRYQTRDAQVTYCCRNTITMPNCQAVTRNPQAGVGPTQPIPVCPGGTRHMTTWMEGIGQNIDDAVTICCS